MQGCEVEKSLNKQEKWYWIPILRNICTGRSPILVNICSPLKNTVKQKTLQEQDLNAPVKAWKTSQYLLPIPLIPTISTLRPLLEQQTPAAGVYSDKSSLHCEPCHPHLSWVNPWIRQCTANSKSVWPRQRSPQIRQCTANSELAFTKKKTKPTCPVSTLG